MRLSITILATSGCGLVLASPCTSQGNQLPIVDLGYNLQRATFENNDFGFYSFNNIRYAAAPVGANRFRNPQKPIIDKSTIQTGSQDRKCPQAVPKWVYTTNEYIPEYLKDPRSFNASTLSSNSAQPVLDNTATEDCLFLDVVTPKHIFENRQHGTGAPVMVWIHGGGFTIGSKSVVYDPATLVGRSTSEGGGIVYVALNYRLGAFGWLSGTSFQTDGQGTPNVGLLDQRFALEWVQRHISKFGGDPNRVTMAGISAGAGSILHHITNNGYDESPSLYNQILLQSPAYFPIVSKDIQDQTFERFLKGLNVSTLDEARELPSEQLQKANLDLIFPSPYGLFTLGPAVDGEIITALPSQLLAQNKVDKSLKVMIGHNQDEGLYFTSPYIDNNERFCATVKAAFPGISNSDLSYVANELYPQRFDGKGPGEYIDQISRTAEMVGESQFSCYMLYLNRAFQYRTYSYEFSIAPALHGDDIAYTFYNATATGSVDQEVVTAIQDYILNFVRSGDPSQDSQVPPFPRHDVLNEVMDLNRSHIYPIADITNNPRCAWWQNVPLAT